MFVAVFVVPFVVVCWLRPGSASLVVWGSMELQVHGLHVLLVVMAINLEAQSAIFVSFSLHVELGLECAGSRLPRMGSQIWKCLFIPIDQL